MPSDRRLRQVALTGALMALLGAATLGMLGSPKSGPSRLPGNEQVRPPAQEAAAASPPRASEPATADAALILEADALTPWRSALRESLSSVTAALPRDADAPTPFARQEPAPLAQTVPLPIPRPPEFRAPSGVEAPRRADRQAARRRQAAAPPVQAEDTRSFFDKLFGVERQPAPALAYAALESNAIEAAPRRRLSPVPVPYAGGGTAVYDIGARVVRLPSGETLEAHSGLGDALDDPSAVHLRMRGPTPPGTYDLTEREQPFHGVRAIRLTPVGGTAEVYGRVGLLAHTYMLGANGASNGCVSFRDYERFLQAYLRGEVRRLVVVPGRGQDPLPGFAGSPARPPRVADNT